MQVEMYCPRCGATSRAEVENSTVAALRVYEAIARHWEEGREIPGGYEFPHYQCMIQVLASGRSIATPNGGYRVFEAANVPGKGWCWWAELNKPRTTTTGVQTHDWKRLTNKQIKDMDAFGRLPGVA